MNDPMINILIRMSAGREEVFRSCIDSIEKQTYRNFKVLISVDESPGIISLGKIPFPYIAFSVKKGESSSAFFYNDYCNSLKSKVESGWFFFLDSDDYLPEIDSLEQIAKELRGDAWQAVVCQMSRDNGKIKPSDKLISSKRIESGRIGLPCLILRAQYKDSLKIGVTENADFEWIKAITDSVATKYVKKVLVHSPKRSFGK